MNQSIAAFERRVSARRLIAEDAQTGCHIWRGRTNTKGYGVTSVDGHTTGAHRANWLLHRGDIPEGMHLDHICKNRLCVNPAHLRPVTPRQNVLENSDSLPAQSLKRNTCKHGHVLTDDNVLPYALPHRICRTCRKVQNEAARARLRKRQLAALDGGKQGEDGR